MHKNIAMQDPTKRGDMHAFMRYDTIEDFYSAAALEYIRAWKQGTPDNPGGICGQIGH